MYDLELRHVRKQYDNGFQAVGDFNLAVEKGEFIAFLGPSGCGKSTVLRMIAGFEKISDGDLLIKGKRINELAPAQRPTAMIFQNYALFPHMTVRQNVSYGLEVRGIGKRQRDDKVDRMLAILGLSDVAERKGSALSGGQRQRVAISRALVTEPEILLLDEPLGALDANLRKAIQNELKLLQKQLGITFIFVTHAQSEALALSDRIVVMNRGNIEQIGNPHTVYTRPDSEFVARFIGRNTLFDGQVNQAADGQWFVERSGQKLAGRPVKDVLHGTGGILVVPGEAFDILPHDAVSRETYNRVAGRIVSSQSIGSLLRINAETDDGLHVRIESLAGKHQSSDLSVGRPVILTWPSAESSIVQA
nr:ABC transporter ATP-binding protein [uncultured Shinella sp.]